MPSIYYKGVHVHDYMDTYSQFQRG